MENVMMPNQRILIGQKLGETYLIIQEYKNNKWQHQPKDKYRGSYHVDKKVKELLKKGIHSIRKDDEKDIVRFKVDKDIAVYINEYSSVKDYPELKLLKQILTMKIIHQKVSKRMVLVKNVPQQIIDNRIMNFILASTLSLGIVNGIAHNIEDKNDIIQAENIQEDIIEPNISLIPNLPSIDINSLKNEYISEQYKASTLNDLQNKSINTHKINDNYLLEQYNQEMLEQTPMIEAYGKMYYMDAEDVFDLYNSNYCNVVNNDNPEKTFLMLVKDEFYSDSSINKIPIVSDMSSVEKEQCIINIAKNIYKIEDEEQLAIMLAIHRLETGNGNSRRCVQDNNPGGLREGSFLTFKTFEIGAEAFVRNALKIINKTYNMADYDYNLSFEKNMQKIYCEGESDWGEQVEGIKYDILTSGDLDNYLENLDEEQKVYSKNANIN